MERERFRRLKELFAATSERAPEERSAFLERVCGDDSSLHREVEALLAAEQEDFLESSALEDFGTDAFADEDIANRESDLVLATGTKLGHYEISEPLGAGSMGAVYRATDSTLGRDVAIKVLPGAFCDNKVRLARFEREAQLLASLNHPHIATLYGFETFAGRPYLVMELVEGQTLAEHIRHRPMAVAEACTCFDQIARALEAAHKRGIIHRDLKPANVRVTPEGTVKLLDFGVAKSLYPTLSEDEPSSSGDSPELTKDGLIVGTPSYMSPEQARGQEIDKRTDIWAFGCCLYEALTGKVAFGGNTASDTLAHILEKEPDWEQLPSNIPSSIRRLLLRCLSKNVDERLRDLGDARLELRDAAHEVDKTSDAAVGKRQQLSKLAVVTLLSLLAAGTTIFQLVFSRKPRPPTRFVVAAPRRFSDEGLAISRDGRVLVYPGVSERGFQLIRRSLDSLEEIPIRGTEGAEHPFLSPDGQWVGFNDRRVLEKVPLEGGRPVILASRFNGVRDGSWAGETIVSSASDGGLFQVSPAGGDAKFLSDGASERWPDVLPGEKAVLYSELPAGDLTSQSIYVRDLETGARRFVIAGGRPRYVPTGHLLFLRESSLWAIAFDLDRLDVEGDAVNVVEDVRTFAVSDEGTLSYIPADAEGQAQLVWLDRNGHPARRIGEPLDSLNPALSPDGKRVAFARAGDIWIHDLERNVTSRCTFDGYEVAAVWSPEGRRIVFNSNRDGSYALYEKTSTCIGSASKVLEIPGQTLGPLDWSPDGNSIVYLTAQSGNRGISVLPRAGQTFVLLDTAFDEYQAKLSPDGHWIAYVSNESGPYEIYVRSFPDAETQWQVTNGGGVQPQWSPNGDELFYIGSDAWLMAVPVKTGQGFALGEPIALFDAHIHGGASAAPGIRAEYDVAPDAQHFLLNQNDPEWGTTPIRVVLDWFAELEEEMQEARRHDG